MTVSDKLQVAWLMLCLAVSVSIFISKLFAYRLEKRLEKRLDILDIKLFELSIDNASVIPNVIQREVAANIKKRTGGIYGAGSDD